MFVVTKCYGRNENRVADFRNEKEAVNFIMEKLQEDRHYKLTATYGLYEGADLLREYSQHDIPSAVADQSSASNTASSGSQKGSGQTFAPTPFNTTPRLGPQTWIKDDAKDDDKDKNS